MPWKNDCYKKRGVPKFDITEREKNTMSMNASAQLLVDLIANPARRFVIPVYQRPYSWDKEHCEQLWEDILGVSRRPEKRHFMGAITWVQDGVMPAGGATPLLLIDGQQRITTVTLLMVALAEYAQNHPGKKLAFSHTNILHAGYLLSPGKKGHDRYKIILSQGDRETLKSILDRLENPERPLVEDSYRLLDNLHFFQTHLEMLEDPNMVWNGLLQLEVVSISLDAGQDNPQLIFESMNSTGKDLAYADLIRNFVLMGLPAQEQEDLYLHYWRTIEKTLGLGTEEGTDVELFNAFLRNYLTVLNAPKHIAHRDVYPMFKRLVTQNGYDRPGRMKYLLEDLKTFAHYHSEITKGTIENPSLTTKELKALKTAFENLKRLGMASLTPFLMSLRQDFDDGAFSPEDFVKILKTLESYIIRRSVCGKDNKEPGDFLSHIIDNLNKIQDNDGNYREAFESFLWLENGTGNCFPGNAEFAEKLRTCNFYKLKRASYILTCLENFYRPKNPLDFTGGNYTIEHIMPRNALARKEWRSFLGDHPEEEFSRLINNIGNLTLTAYNSELADASFAEKRARFIGGYDNDYLVISKTLKHTDVWDSSEIGKRADWLIETAKNRWPDLSVSGITAKRYASQKEAMNRGIPQSLPNTSFRSVFKAGLIFPGAKLRPSNEKYDAQVMVTEKGTLVFSDGQEFRSPTLAAAAVVRQAGKPGIRDGWKFWRIAPDGPTLDKLRTQYLVGQEDRIAFRLDFWRGFFNYCATRPGFVEAFSDPFRRIDNPSSWAEFGLNRNDCSLVAIVWKDDPKVAIKICCQSKIPYKKLWNNRKQIVHQLAKLDRTPHWDALDAKKRHRDICLYHTADWHTDDLTPLYEWMATAMFELRGIVTTYLYASKKQIRGN
jgi:uncharacterized protein with ParB-like and HNH nuclease domain